VDNRIFAKISQLSSMDDRQRQLAFLRFMEIEAELEALAEGRVVDGDPATVEAELLGERSAFVSHVRHSQRLRRLYY
jgi:hypothetical protein